MCYCDQDNSFHLDCYKTILAKTTKHGLTEATLRLHRSKGGGNNQT